MFVYEHMSTGAFEGQMRVSDPLELEFRSLQDFLQWSWLPSLNPARAVRTLNH